MPYIAYREKKFLKRATLIAIERANAIIAEYAAMGYSLTLRQLYYQFVARDFIPNSLKEYKKLGEAINTGRLSGMIDWEAIEDRTRGVAGNSHWDSPKSVLRSARDSFAYNKWQDQDVHVEVWVEKEALVGVVEKVCTLWDVPYLACRGYVSQSEQWRAGQRFENALNEGKEVLVLHLGDHDPSGIDMTRDNRERVNLFATGDEDIPDAVQVRRIALNMDQIRKHKPPPNPAKLTDSRVGGYMKAFGKQSWELDALPPQIISGMIEDHILNVLDRERFDAWVAKEKKVAAKIDGIIKRWKD